MNRPIVEESRKTGADMHGASPSKNLFSPHLKYDGTEVSKDDSYEASTPPRDEAVQQQQQTENDDDDDDDVFNPYQFISCLPSHESVYIKGKICLPSKVSRSRITLALDLDETLVHCTIEPIENPDLIFPVK